MNVTARICDGRNAPEATWLAIRCVIVVVLPEPAPARMQTGPRTASTARRCSAFSSIGASYGAGPPELVPNLCQLPIATRTRVGDRTTTASGGLASRTLLSTCFVFGSIRITLPLRLLTTQT